MKKGTRTVGVQRQYSGTAGSNRELAGRRVLRLRGRARARRGGPGVVRPALMDVEPDRCQVAGRGDQAIFATKPEPAARMIGRFLDAGRRAPCVAGDEVYGSNPKLRAVLEERGRGYVLAVARTHEVPTHARKFRADALARKLRSGLGRSCPQEPTRRGTASTTGRSAGVHCPCLPASTRSALGYLAQCSAGCALSRRDQEPPFDPRLRQSRSLHRHGCRLGC
ncbi:transposase [Streptomyces sp. NPDC048269]|uniref:transposase n=1 Tax=Streptomyces sp. NPDC048269 TaxID=3155753 RepID=UPI0034416491